MKRSLYFAAALAIVGAVSCNKELVDNSTPEVPEAKLATLTATIGEPGTKTSLATPENAHVDGSKTFWCAADAISVFDGKSNVEYTIKDSESYEAAEEAVFEGEELDAEATEFFALYPYTETAEVADGVVKGAVLPAEQTAVAGNIPEGAALAVAYSTDKSALYFKNVATTIGFTLTTDATSVQFIANNEVKIAGTINITSDGNDIDYEITSGSDRVTLTGDLKAGKKYFFTTLPDVTLTDGYTLAINGYVVKSTDTEVMLGRSKIYNIGETGFAAPVKTSKVYIKPGIWSSDSPWYAVYFYGVSGDNTVKMTESAEYSGLYEVEVPEGYDNLIFCRMNPEYNEFGWNVYEGETLKENHVWTQSTDLVVPDATDDKVCYVINDWDSAEWITLEEATAGPVAGEESEWALVGAFKEGDSNWIEIQMLTTSTENLFVAEDVIVPTDYTSMLIKKFGDANWTIKYGGGHLYFNPNNWMTVYENGSDINVTEAGTYDFYFDKANARLYAVAAGTDYTSVPKQEAEGEAPELEIPDVTENVIYLQPHEEWFKYGESNNGWFFAAYFFGNGDTWLEMKDEDEDGYYECNIPDGGYTSVIFVQMLGNKTLADKWNAKKNQTVDLTIPTDGKNLFVMENPWNESSDWKATGTWATK